MGGARGCNALVLALMAGCIAPERAGLFPPIRAAEPRDQVP
jgi:hypothetical protein